MDNPDAAFEEYIPTDKFNLIDEYMYRLHRLGHHYRTAMRAAYLGGYDGRTIADFYATAREFFEFARANISKHLTKENQNYLEIALHLRARRDIENVEQIYQLIQEFADKSGLTKLSEKRFLGSFAYARKELGLKTERRQRDTNRENA